MKTSISPVRAASAAIFALVFAGSAQAVPIVPGFVYESRGKFEYNTGVIHANEDTVAAFTYFGQYPGHFDLITVYYAPGVYLENDSEISVGTFYMNDYYWSGAGITGTSRYYTYSQPHGRLRITATYQDAVAGSHIGNVNIKGLYVPDTGSTLILLGGTFAAGVAVRSINRRKKEARRCR